MEFQWLAQYGTSDGLPQWNDDGTENKYADIDRGRLTAFAVLTEEARPVLVVHIPEGGRLIYRQRHEQFGNDPSHRVTVWIVGVQTNEGGVNRQIVSAIFPDGHVENVLRFHEGTRWFYPPVPHPQEGETWGA